MRDLAIQASRLFLELFPSREGLSPCGRFLGSPSAGEGVVAGADERLGGLGVPAFLHFLSVYFFLIDPQKFIDGSTSSPGCSVINENPGPFKFRADPVGPWITIKSPKAAIWSRGKRNNLAANFFCLAQSRNRERRPSCLASQRRFLGNVASWAQGTFRKGQDQKQTAKVREKFHCSNSG